jgi:ribosome recycling factor
MYNQTLNEKKADFEKVIEHFKIEIGKIRTGRANPSMVEDLLVDYYGAKTPLKQIATINTPEPRTISIQPWDRGALGAIEGAIRDSELNLNPNNDGVIIRINIPQLTEERRREMVKLLNAKAEEARIGVRNVREDSWKELQEMEKIDLISEDDKFKAKEKLQEIVDSYNKVIEDIRAKKEQEMMTV